MYNSNVALIHYSAPKDLIQTLAAYQFFTGLGLVLGPLLSATFYAVGSAAGLNSASALINFVIFIYAVLFLISVVIWLPENDDLEVLAMQTRADSTGDEDRERTPLLLEESSRTNLVADTEATQRLRAIEQDKKDAEYMQHPYDEFSTEQLATIDASGLFGLRLRILLGNFLRISIRLAQEVGLVVILIYEFNFTVVTSAIIVAMLGAAQTIAQMLFITQNLPASPFMLQVLEMVQFMSVMMMFVMPFYMASRPLWFMALFFILCSFVTYVSNCLSSAPLNYILLSANDRLKGEREPLMLASQVGIFLGFIVGPMAALGGMVIADSDTVDVLAAVLLVGCVCQALLTNVVIAGRGGTALTIMYGVVAWLILTISMLDVNVNGNGFANVFTYHPIFMGFAFLVLMTMGVLAYRGDSQGMLTHLGQFYDLQSKQEKRRLHIILQASAATSALLGYIFIFIAHALVGESQIGLNTTWPRTLHVYLGYISLAWICRQITVGILKITPKEEQPSFLLNESTHTSKDWVTSMMSLHGEQGRYLLMFAYCIIIEGIWLTMNTSTWGWSVKIVMTSLVAGALIMFWLPKPLDAKPKET